MWLETDFHFQFKELLQLFRNYTHFYLQRDPKATFI